MIDHILVPLDGSALAESVLPHLFALARAFDARVTILHVIGQSDPGRPDQRIDPLDWQMRRAEAQSYLSTVKNRLTHAGLSVSCELLYGDTATRIVEYIQNQDVDLLLLSNHGQSGTTGWNISSVVQKTVIRVQIPTMIVRALGLELPDQVETHYEKILVPLDGSSRAEFVLPLAASLSTFHKAQLILAHVVQEPELPRKAPRSQEENELVHQFVERNKLEAARYFEELRKQFPINLKVHLVVGGNVSDTLHALVEQENPDLMVMTAHGYSGSAIHPFGNLALNFIVYGTNPILIVQDMPESCESLPISAEIQYKEKPGH